MTEINNATAPSPLLRDPEQVETPVPTLDDLMPDDLRANDLVMIDGSLLQFIAKEERGPLVFFDGDQRTTVRFRTTEIIQRMGSDNYVRPGGSNVSTEDISELDDAGRERLRMLFGAVQPKPRKRAKLNYLYVGHFTSKLLSARADQRFFAKNETNAKIVIDEIDKILERHNTTEPDASKHLLPPRHRSARTILKWVETECKYHLGEVGQVHGNALRKHEHKLPQRVFDLIAETIREAIWISGRFGPAKIRTLVNGKIRELNARGLNLPLAKKSTVYKEYTRYDAWIRVAKDKGIKAADLEFGSVGKLERPKRVNDLWALDHHKFDLHLILGALSWSENSLPRVFARSAIDRFWICLALDEFSGYPTGFCISFEPGGLLPALSCTDHAVRLKTYVKERWPHINGALLGYGKPVRIRYDNAKEFVSLQMSTALARVGIGFAHSRKGEPDSNPRAERFFGTMERDFIEWLKGATGSSPKAKQGRNPVEEACIQPDDFLMLFHQYLIECYARRPQENLGWRTPEQVWMAAQEHPTCRPRPLRQAELNRLDVIASIEIEVPATREGIKWKDHYYQSPELQKMRRTSGIGFRGGNSTRFRARIPLKNIGLMYVAPLTLQDDALEITVPCTNPNTYGLTAWQDRVIRAEKRCRKAKADNLAEYEAGFLRLFRNSLEAMGVKLPGEPQVKKSRLTGGQAPRFAGVFLPGPEFHALHKVQETIDRFDLFGEIAAIAAKSKTDRVSKEDTAAAVQERVSRWTTDPINLLRDPDD